LKARRDVTNGLLNETDAFVTLTKQDVECLLKMFACALHKHKCILRTQFLQGTLAATSKTVLTA